MSNNSTSIQFERCIASSDNSVKKYVYSNSTAVVECVLYKYPDYATRTVLCVSVQSGCKVGCLFCGTGKHFFRNLTSDEIVHEVSDVFKREGIDTKEVKKLQIMFMSMGEPSHNWVNLDKAIHELHATYPNAQLLVSTVGTRDKDFYRGIIKCSKDIDVISLQFSVHHWNDKDRNVLIPYQDKLTLQEIAQFGTMWHEATGRKPYCNYVVTKSNFQGVEVLFDVFDPNVFCFTFSVLCSPTSTVKKEYVNNRSLVEYVSNKFLEYGYDVRVFDPAGQDDIGGGCGQLWYFQDRVKEELKKFS